MEELTAAKEVHRKECELIKEDLHKATQQCHLLTKQYVGKTKIIETIVLA